MVVRSSTSLDFEAAWSDLRENSELIPQHSEVYSDRLIDYLPVSIIVEINPTQKSMPIRLAGSSIRDFIGFEITGQDLITNLGSTVFDTDDDDGWPVRFAYHDQPVGRYNKLVINFRSGMEVECSLTALPLWGSKQKRLILILVEAGNPTAMQRDDTAALISSRPDYAIYLDIGAGIPDLGRHDGDRAP